MTTKAERDAMRKHLDPKHILPEDYQPTRVSTLLSLLDAADELESIKSRVPVVREYGYAPSVLSDIYEMLPEPPQPEKTP